jgi:CyaY protein
MDSLTDTEFQDVAIPELAHLLQALDELGDVDADLEGDILLIEFEDESQCVINTQSAARQIWMSAERTAWHFDWVKDQKRWIASKSGDELWATVGRVVGSGLGRQVELNR